MKRILSFLMALAMSFSIVMPSVAAAYEGRSDASASVSDVSSPEGSGSVQAEAETSGSSSAQEAISSEEPQDEEALPEDSSRDTSKAEQTAEVVVPARKTIRQKLKTVDGVKYTFTLTYDEAAQLPEDTELSIVEVNQALTDEEKALKENKERPYDTEKFVSEKALEQESFDLRQGLKVRDKDYLLFAKFLDLTLTSGGKKVQPKAPVEITLETNAVTEGASDALNVAVYDKDATKEWQKELEKLRKERKARIKSGKVVEVEKREKEKVFQRLKVTNQTEKDKGVKLSFQLEKFTRLGVAGVAKHLRSWKVQDETVSVYGPRGLKALVNSERMSAPEAGLEKVRAFSVKPNEKKNPKYDVTFWVGTQSKAPESGEEADSAADTTNTLSAQAAEESPAPEDNDTGVVVSKLQNGKAKKELIGTEGADTPVAIEQGELVGLTWDTGLRSQSIEAENVSVEGLLPKKAQVSADDVLWRYSRPGQVNKKADPEAETLAAYDITISSRKGDFQPEAGESVSVSIQNENISANKDLEVWHLKDNGTVEVIQNFQVEGDTISFDATGFSVYMVVQVTKELVLTASDGKDYKITVNYDTGSGIPEDAELSVSEIKDGKDYDKYVKDAAKALDKEVRHLDFARAFDISLINPETKEHYQPAKDVKVSIQLLTEDVKEGDGINVVHFGEETEVLESSVNGESVEFKTDGFSVYVVVDNLPTKTFRFLRSLDHTGSGENLVWTDEYTQYRQVLTNGDHLVQPSEPGEEGMTFNGWKKVNLESATAGASVPDEYWGTEVTGLANTTDADGKEVVTRQEEVFVADFGARQCKVTYYDQNEAVVYLYHVSPGDTISPNNKTASGYQSYTPIQNVEDTFLMFEHWTEEPYGSKEKAGTITVNKDIALYPVVSEAHHIYLNSNSSAIDDIAVSYVAPIPVLPDQSPESDVIGTRIVPTAKGYTFKGWYLVSDNDRNDSSLRVFNADGTLNQTGWNKLKTKMNANGISYDPTLYAHWELSNEPAKYSVAYYVQRDGDKYGGEAHYDFLKIERSGTAPIGSTISVDPSIDTVQAAFKENRNGPDLDRYQQDLLGFERNDELSVPVTVKEDGSTVLNVYFSRKAFTLVFYDYQWHGSNGGNAKTEISNAELEKTYKVNTGGWWTPEYTDFRFKVVRQWTALYGEDVSSKFPVSSDKSQGYYLDHSSGSFTTNGYKTSMTHNAWIDADKSSPKVTALFRRLDNMPALVNQTEYIVHNSIDSPYLHLNYYLEVLNPTNQMQGTEVTNNLNPNASPVYVRKTGPNGVTKVYKRLGGTLHYASLGITSTLAYPINGYTYYFASPEFKSDGYANEKYYNTFNLYYTRNSHTIHLINSLDSSENRSVSFAFEEPVTETDERLAKFEKIDNVYPIDDNIYWYYDEDCTSPVDFDNLTMPNRDLTFYAGLKYSYLVKVDPADGELMGGSPKSGNDYYTWLRVDKGNTIPEYTNITRDYIPISELPEDETTVYVYDEHPYSAAKPEAQRQRYAIYREATEAERNDDSFQKYIYSPGEYTFIGWFEANSSGTTGSTPFDFATKIMSPVTLKAKWRPTSQFRIVYDAGGVQAPEDEEAYVAGANARVMGAVDAPANKQFRGWQVQKGNRFVGSVLHANDLLPIQESDAGTDANGNRIIKLVAKYDDATLKNNETADYKFLLPDARGEYHPDEKPYYLETLSQGEVLVRPVQPEPQNGMQFEGWYTDSACTRRFTGFGTVGQPKNTNIYARFANIHTVTYYDAVQKDGSWTRGSNILAVQQYTDGTTLDTSRVTYSIGSDRHVTKWHVEKASGGSFSPEETPYQSSSTGVTVTEDLVLWPEMQFYQMLIFDSQGGTDVPAQRIPEDGGWPHRPVEPTRYGYTFQGWFTSPTKEFNSDKTLNRSKEYNFDNPVSQISGLTNNTLYAWWLPKNGEAAAKYTVVWWAQTASGGKEYEFQKAKPYTGVADTQVDITSSAWIAENGDPRSTVNLESIESDYQKYFTYTDASAEAKVKDVSEITTPTATIEEDGSTVINVYFHRTRYTYKFDPTKDATIHKYVNQSDTFYTNASNKMYKFDFWLDKPISNEWPVLDDSNKTRKKAGKPYVVMSSGDFAKWTGPSLSVATILVVPNTADLEKARTKTDKTVVYKLEKNTSQDSREYHVRYYFDEELIDTYGQTLYRPYSTVDFQPNLTTDFQPKDGVTFCTALGAKEFEGFEVIHTKKDALDNNQTHFCPDITVSVKNPDKTYSDKTFHNCAHYTVENGVKYLNFYYRSKPYYVKLYNNDRSDYLGKDGKHVVERFARGDSISTYLNSLPTPDVPSDMDPNKIEFACWSVTPDTPSPSSETTMPARDISLFATWRKKTVTVTLLGVDEYGNTGEGLSYTITKPAGSSLREFNLPTPRYTEPGTSFVGWHQDTEQGKLWTAYESVNQSITLVPESKDKHVVSPVYRYNGGVLTSGQSIPNTTPVSGQTDRVRDAASYMQGASAVVKSGAALTKNSRTFAAWNTKADGSGEDYYPGEMITLSKKETVLYARYAEPRKVTLVYHLNGGTRFEPYGDDADEFEETSNYRYKDSAGTEHRETVVQVKFEEYDKDIDYTKAENKSKHYPNTNYRASWDNNKIPFRPVRSGYYFVGWSKTPGATMPEIMEDDKIRVNPLDSDDENRVHVYAVWAVCKIEDGDKEIPFQSLKAAVDYAKAKMDGTATIKMLANYQKPVSDDSDKDDDYQGSVVIPSGCSITLTTADTREKDKEAHNNKAKWRFHFATTDFATIKRHYTGSSLFTVDGSTLTLENITLDGDKERYTCNSDGGLVYVKSGSLVISDADATLQNSKANSHKGGAVYVEDGGTMTMSAGTINGNQADAGAGIYLEQGATLKLSGSPNFGGTDRKGRDGADKDDLKGESGNFAIDTPSGKKNGGKDYYKYRQDIFIAGYDNDANAVSLNVTGELTDPTDSSKAMPEGSIWVWAEKASHYKQLKQFAQFSDDGDNLSNDDKAISMKAFRNAQSDDATGCSGEYLTGQFNPKDSNDKTHIYWTGVIGYQKVILKKVGEATTPKPVEEKYYKSLSGAKFDICDSNGHAYQWKDPKNPNGGTTELSFGTPTSDTGIIWIGELPYGIYYLKETNAPKDYSSNKNTWFYLIVYKGGVYQSGAYTGNDSGYPDMLGGYPSLDSAKKAATDMNNRLKTN